VAGRAALATDAASVAADAAEATGTGAADSTIGALEGERNSMPAAKPKPTKATPPTAKMAVRGPCVVAGVFESDMDFSFMLGWKKANCDP
jgi:hypothetical protein